MESFLNIVPFFLLFVGLCFCLTGVFVKDNDSSRRLQTFGIAFMLFIIGADILSPSYRYPQRPENNRHSHRVEAPIGASFLLPNFLAG